MFDIIQSNKLYFPHLQSSLKKQRNLPNRADADVLSVQMNWLKSY